MAQLTTDGDFWSFRVQIFPSGDQVNDVRPDMTFEQQPLGAFARPIIEEGPADAVVSCDDIPGLPEDEFTLSYANATADVIVTVRCKSRWSQMTSRKEIALATTPFSTVEIENCRRNGTARLQLDCRGHHGTRIFRGACGLHCGMFSRNGDGRRIRIGQLQ